MVAVAPPAAAAAAADPDDVWVQVPRFLIDMEASVRDHYTPAMLASGVIAVTKSDATYSEKGAAILRMASTSPELWKAVRKQVQANKEAQRKEAARKRKHEAKQQAVDEVGKHI